MIELQVGSWQSRILAVSLGLLLIGLLWVGLVRGVDDWRQQLRAEHASLLQTIARLRAAVVSGSAKIAPDAPYADPRSLAVDFLDGTDDPVIIADVQTRLRAIVVGQNAELSSFRTLPGKRFDQQDYIGLRLLIRGSMGGIHAIVHAIENSTPILFIERLQLRLEDRRGGGDDASGDAAPMIAEIDVFGARWPRNEASANR